MLAKEGRNAFMQELCAAFLDNGLDDMRCSVTRSEAVVQEVKKQNEEWGYHHENVKMTLKAEGVKNDGKSRIQPINCVHCVKNKIKGDKRTTDCCLECNKPSHQKCHAVYHMS